MKTELIKITTLFCVLLYVYGDCTGKSSVIRNGKEYRLFFNLASKQAARQACRAWGEEWKSSSKSDLIQEIDGDLQVCLKQMIGSVETSVQYDRTFNNPGQRGYFIGGTLNNSTDRPGWYWDQGRKIPLPDQNGSFFQKWARNHPVHTQESDEKRCMSAVITTEENTSNYEPGDWIDQNCNYELFYICQRDVPQDLIWGYSDNEHAIQPEDWGTIKEFGQCNSNIRQSPQDVNVSRRLRRCDDNNATRVLRWETNESGNISWIVRNTGRLIEIKMQPNRSLLTRFKENNATHAVDYMLLKWGGGARNGSEHTVGGVQYAGELQVYHKPNEEGEIHAFSFLIQQRPYINNRNWRPLITAITRIFEANSETTMESPPNHIMTLLGESSQSRSPDYILESGIRYNGSLTQPPCTENIIWTVFPRPIQLSFAQFNVFRQLRMEGRRNNDYRLITQTTRPIQIQNPGHCVLDATND